MASAVATIAATARRNAGSLEEIAWIRATCVAKTIGNNVSWGKDHSCTQCTTQSRSVANPELRGFAESNPSR